MSARALTRSRWRWVCPTDAGGCERAGSRRARTSARNGIPRNDRVSSLCPRSSRDWQPPFDGESRQKGANEIENVVARWSRCSWDRFEQKGAGPGLAARRQPPSYQSPRARPVVSPFSSSSIASQTRSTRLDSNSGLASRAVFDFSFSRLRVAIRRGSSVSRTSTETRFAVGVDHPRTRILSFAGH